MITPTSPSGHSAFRACAGPHIPMATVARPSTQCEWATSQVLPNWDDREPFWENLFTFLLSLRNRLLGSTDLISDTCYLNNRQQQQQKNTHTLIFEVLHLRSVFLQSPYLSLFTSIFTFNFSTAVPGIYKNRPSGRIDLIHWETFVVCLKRPCQGNIKPA